MQTIYLDISNKGTIPCIQAKQSEVGRKFLAVITDNGVPYNVPSNSLMSVWYEGDTDAGNYSSIEEKSAFSIDGNKISVELVAQMLLKPGKGDLCLSITHGDGGETNTWNIPYNVEYKPGASSTVPTEYYTALTEAGSIAAEAATNAQAAANQANALVSSIFPFFGYCGSDGVNVDDGKNGLYLSQSSKPIQILGQNFYNGHILSFSPTNNSSCVQVAVSASQGLVAMRTRWFTNAWSEWFFVNSSMATEV